MTAPPAPTIASFNVDGLSLALSEDASLAEFAAVVESDPALTAAVLRAANSAVSSPLSPVAAASDAIVRIGMAEARRIVVGAALSGPLGGIEEAGADIDEMWRHLLTIALLADASAWLSMRPGDQRRQGAFTAGILHDVGHLAMIQERPHAVATVRELGLDGAESLEAERLIFGYDHAERGADLARAWKLPDELVESIASHHTGGDDPLSQAVFEGRVIANGLGIGDGLFPAVKAETAELPSALVVLGHVGGPNRLGERVNWYRAALSG